MENSSPQYPKIPNQNQALLVIILTGGLIFFAGFLTIILGLKKSQFLLIEGLTILPALIFVIKGEFSLHHTFRLKTINMKIVITSVVIGFALSVLADEADRLVAMIFPMPDAFMDILKETMKISSTGELIIIVLSAVVFAGICEELLFRGFLQKSLERSFDTTKAIMLTSLIFAIIHMNPWWTIQIILLAVFLGVMAWKSDSIFPSIIAHSINNGLALIFANTEEANIGWYFTGNHVNPLIIFAAILTIFFGFQQFYRYCDEHNNEQILRSQRKDWDTPIN